jgi:hypothetical protein
MRELDLTKKDALGLVDESISFLWGKGRNQEILIWESA